MAESQSQPSSFRSQPRTASANTDGYIVCVYEGGREEGRSQRARERKKKRERERERERGGGEGRGGDGV